ncbi:MAG: undecaprenyl-phosphate glucose phosphotransferase [Acidobacteria bacterium]|nr:undecaprenyl-phosphate glucose phosphotransferase [Acidobacteriota bacterium]
MTRKTSYRFYFFLDLVVIYACFLGVFVYYSGLVPIHPKSIFLMIAIAAIWFVISINLDIVSLNAQSRALHVIRSVIISYSVLTMCIIAIVGITGDYRYNDRLILYPMLFSVLISSGLRLLSILLIHYFLKNSRYQKEILLIGKDLLVKKVYDQIHNSLHLGYRIKGIFSDDGGEYYPKALHLGRLDQFFDIVSAGYADEVIIALPLSMERAIIQMVNDCEREGLRARILLDLSCISKNLMMLDKLGNISLIAVRPEPLSLLRNRIAKRICDIVFSFTALIVFSPLLLVLASAIKLSSRGPILFKQKRIGINNKDFYMYKFRSMIVQDSEDSDKIWTKQNDSRITAIGKFMRKTNLDELPQFWNSLVGDMSVVGPRPEREFFVEQFMNDIPSYRVRHLVKSGITGLAQVNGWRGDTSIQKRVELDIHYLENWSFGLDLKIIWLTLFGRNVQKNAY